MIDIYLVRHGEAAASWGQSPDPGLSELGHEQARNAAHALQPLLAGAEPVLISSPLARALETAAPLADELGLSVQVNEAFRRAAHNIPCVDVLPQQGANVYDILRRDTLVLTKDAVAALEARLK